MRNSWRGYQRLEEFIESRHTSPLRGTPYEASSNAARPSPSTDVYTWRTYIMLGRWPGAGSRPHPRGSLWPSAPMFPGSSNCFKSRYTIKESASHHRICRHYAFFATDAYSSWGIGLSREALFQVVPEQAGTGFPTSLFLPES
jgi:hypothetical protein